MKLLIMIFVLTGCGGTYRVKGGTTHVVSGESKVIQEIVLKIDVSGCEDLEGQEQAECITNAVKALGDLVTVIKSLTCKDVDCLESAE